jgi:putative nucleotidyltransferase with HDIG domain
LLVLTIQLLPSRYALSVGDVSPYDIRSPGKVTFVSQALTDQERSRASAAVPVAYQSLPDASVAARQQAQAVFGEISQIRAASDDPSSRASRIRQLPNLAINQAAAADLIAMDDVQWQDTMTQTLRIVDRTMLGRITPPQISEAQATVPSLVEPGTDSREANAIVALARALVQPTEAVDDAATASARQAAANAVQPVSVTVEKGEIIVRSGDVVTAEDLEKLEAVGLRTPTVRWLDLAAMLLLAAAFSGILCAYLYRFQPATAASPRRLLLLAVLVVAPILAARLVIPGRDLYSILFPVAAAPMLVAILLDTQLAFVVAIIQGIAMGLITSDGLELTAATVVAGSLGALAVYRLERLNVLTLAVGLVTVADFCVVVAFRLPNGDVDLQALALYGFLALVSGALSGALTVGTVSFLGHVFDIATTMNLLELAHPSQPLFRRLLTEAPGTYHHSVLVANLAERAAASIGADTLLVRIGGYYHDIGKLNRPYAFVENQIDGQNVHDQLDSHHSARLIIAHVTDGLALAQKHGIPARIQDLIAQHHGTMLVQYFFWQAQQGAEEPVDESAFRYPGPRPQSREAAIMMLADSVEAAVRSGRDYSAERVAAVIDQIIQDRTANGQLDECELTLNDLRKIRAAFLSVLQGIYHPRIEYPANAVIPAPVAGGPR